MPGQPLFKLQPMTLADVHTVSLMERQVFATPWSANAFRYEIEQNRTSNYYVLRYIPWFSDSATTLRAALRRVFIGQEQDSSLLGYGGFWFVIDEAHITNLALRQEWRGQGLGEMLLLGLIERARRLGAQTITLEVRASNLVAQALYYKYGFSQVGLRRRYYTDNHEDACLMTAHQVHTAFYATQLESLRGALVARLAANPPHSRHNAAT